MANVKLTDKTALTEQLGSGDLFMVVDVNDTTSSSSGTSKKFDTKFLLQTDKFSLDNTEVLALDSSPKTLVSALSGYMVTPISATVLVTSAGSNETSNKDLIIGYDDSQDTMYWDSSGRFFSNKTASASYILSGKNNTSGVDNGSLINKPLKLWASSTGFNGGWSMDIYLTYFYTKIL